MPRNPDIDATVARVARGQHGVLTWEQLREAGLSPGAIGGRVSRSQLHRVSPRVYSVADPALVPLARESAALLSLGPDAILSHSSAALLWGMIRDRAAAVHVTVAGGNPRPRPGVTIHRVKALARSDVRVRNNLRLTAPARTVIDYAGEAPSSELEDVLAEARVASLVTDRELEEALGRAPRNDPGAAEVRSLLTREEGRADTRSRMERKCLKLMRDADLPVPRANAIVGGFRVDFLWPELRLILELDGYRFHRSRRRFEGDRRKDQILKLHTDHDVFRGTWRQVDEQPMVLVATVAQAIARARLRVAADA